MKKGEGKKATKRNDKSPQRLGLTNLKGGKKPGRRAPRAFSKTLLRHLDGMKETYEEERERRKGWKGNVLGARGSVRIHL